MAKTPTLDDLAPTVRRFALACAGGDPKRVTVQAPGRALVDPPRNARLYPNAKKPRSSK